MRATRNRVYGQPYQGFESLLLRQNKMPPCGVFFYSGRGVWTKRSQQSCRGRQGVDFASMRSEIVTTAAQACNAERIPSSPPGISYALNIKTYIVQSPGERGFFHITHIVYKNKRQTANHICLQLDMRHRRISHTVCTCTAFITSINMSGLLPLKPIVNILDMLS